MGRRTDADLLWSTGARHADGGTASHEGSAGTHDNDHHLWELRDQNRYSISLDGTRSLAWSSARGQKSVGTRNRRFVGGEDETMKVVYVTRTSFLDTALNRIRTLASAVELHVLVEVAPESWGGSMFDAAPRQLLGGVQDASDILSEMLPEGAIRYLSGASSVELAVFSERRSVHPETMAQSRRIARHVAGLGADVVHLDDIGMRLSWGLRDMGPVPMVVSIHDPFAHSGERNWRTGLARWLTFRRSSRFVLHNHNSVQAFCSRYGINPARVDVSLLGPCDVLREWANPSPGGDEEPVDILCFGRMSRYKGIDLLSQAAGMIAEAVPGVRIVVAGSPSPGFIPPESRDLPNGGRFEVEARHISNCEAAALFAKARIVVLPYRDATQSGVALSAFAFGRPVIATRCGGLPDYVIHGHNGLLVDVGSPTAIALASVEALTDNELLESLQEGVRRDCVERLQWKRVADEHMESYRRCLFDAT